MTNTTNQEGVDMGYIHAVFKSLADTIVTASELPKQMEAIKADMSGLTADLERTKARNIELDTLLADTRRQRDEAEQNLSETKAYLVDARNNATHLEHMATAATQEAERIRAELASVRKERDDYGLKHMEAEDRANQAEAKLKKLREALGMAEEPKPVPNSPSITPASGTPEQSVTSSHTPAPDLIPSPPPIQQVGEHWKVYEGDEGYDVFKAHNYDPTNGRYWHYAD